MAGEDDEYVRWVRSRYCLLTPVGGCDGPVEAHHAGRDRGMGQRADDSTAVPLCHRHHVCDWHGATGAFKGWSRAQRRAWADWAVERTRAAYAASLLPLDVPF